MKTSRKLKIGLISCVGLAAFLSTVAVAQQRDEEERRTNFTVQDWPINPVREGKIYFIPGGGDTSTVIIGDKGVIVVDAKVTKATGEHLIKKVATLTSKPITHVIETHSDCDHVNGIAGFPTSVQVIAHYENRREQEKIARLASVEIDGGYGVAPLDRAPNVLIRQNGETATINGVRLVFYHWAPGHTSGDLMIYLPDEKVMVAGDILFSSGRANGGSFKFEKDGSPAGWFKNVEGMLSTDAELFVTGHGRQLMTRAEVQQRLDDFRIKMAKVDALAASGKSLAETVAAMGDPPFDPMANTIKDPYTIKECPRAIRAMTDSWIRWHEWTYENKILNKMAAK